MIRSTHLAIQLSNTVWLVTFVSELGLTETKQMSSREFVEMIREMQSWGEYDEHDIDPSETIN